MSTRALEILVALETWHHRWNGIENH